MPLLLKPRTAKKFWKSRATRLVALADVIGSPRNVKIGTENNEPPPPTVFKKAARKPVMMTIGIW
jgi:hypothetical protein